MIRVAIVEDELKCAELLQAFIARYSEEEQIQFHCTWFRDGLEFISAYKAVYDVIFMDIRMPHFDGMKTAERLREYDSEVALIFVTNMIQYAIKGYEVNALDFMLKPVRYYDFRMKLLKAVEYVKRHQDNSVTIDIDGVKKKLLLRDIYTVEVENHTLTFRTAQGDISLYGQLKKVEELLQGKNIVRCNSYCLVNLQHVMEVHSNHIVVGNHEVPISRRKRAAFMEQLVNYTGVGI